MSNLAKATWGPACWTVIHAAAASCEPEEATAFAAFLYSLTHVLPCPECRAHLRTYLERHPPDQLIRDAESASRFCFDLHNFVNHETGKPVQGPRIVRTLYDVNLGGLREDFRPPARALTRRMPRSRRSYRIL